MASTTPKPTTNPQRPGVRVAVQPAVSDYLMVEEMKKIPGTAARVKVPCSNQASSVGLREPQMSWADPTHAYYQMADRPLLRNFGPPAVAANPLQRGHSEGSYSRNTMVEDRRCDFPLPPSVTGIGKYSPPQTWMEFPKADMGPARKPCKSMKQTQIILEDPRHSQETKGLVQAEKSFLECLIKNHKQYKKTQERPRKGCAQECGEIEKGKERVASGIVKQTTDLHSQDKKDQTDPSQPLQAVTRQRASPERNLSEPDVQAEEAQRRLVQEKSQACPFSARESEPKNYPSINRENQPLWRKLEQLAQDYYRVEETRKQLLRQKQERKYKRWDSVIRGTSITLAEREQKQRCPKDPDVTKTPPP